MLMLPRGYRISVRIVLPTLVLSYIFFFAPEADGQQSGNAAPASQPSKKNSTSAPTFFDPPQFTVSGVTDTTSLGGHGSNAVIHTRDALAKDAASLGKAPPAPSRPDSESRDQLMKEKEHLQVQIAQTSSPELHHRMAVVDEQLGDSLAAVREYQRAAEMNPNETFLFDWGAELLLHHASEPATEVFVKGSKAFPTSERMFMGLGASWLARGSDDQAVRFIVEASDLHPNDAAPYVFLGKIQSMEKTPREQITEKLKRFVTLYPSNPEANYYYAVALWKQRSDPQDAARTAHVEELLNAAIRLDPQFTAAYLQLGIVHADRHEFEKAIGDYQNAIQAPGSAAKNEFGESPTHGSANGSNGPGAELQEAHFRLAQVYRQMNQPEAAKAEFEVYQRMNRASEEQADRERHEVQQFVYTLRDKSAAKPQ